MDFRPTEEQDLLRRTVRESRGSEIGPHVMEWDEAQHSLPISCRNSPHSVLPAYSSPKLLRRCLSAVDYCICIEELARVSASRGALRRGAQRTLFRAYLDVR